jgi:hypothetical protein
MKSCSETVHLVNIVKYEAPQPISTKPVRGRRPAPRANNRHNAVIRSPKSAPQ